MDLVLTFEKLLKMNKLILTYLVAFLAFPFAGSTQAKEKIELNDGVAQYERGKYKDAQTKFEKAYAENPNYARALYNAGNSAYLSGNFDTAMIYYNDYAQKVDNKNEIAKAHFNIGNANLQKAKNAEANPETMSTAQSYYKEAINSYKQSLKNNPNDIEAKYNLTYALDKLKKNQEQQQQDKNNQSDKSDQEKEKQDKGEKGDKGEQGENGDPKENDDQQGDKGDKQEGDENGNQESEEKGDQEKDPNGNPDEQDQEKEGDEKDGKGQDNKEGKQNDEQPVEGQISKAQAIKDLDAINDDEGKILQKVYQKKGDKKGKTSSGKDW